MVTLDEFSRLVSDIHAAALAPPLWEPAVRNIHRALGATGGGLFMAGEAVFSSLLPAEATTSYAEYYHRLDYVMTMLNNGPVGAIRSGTELITPHRKSEFYVDWVRRYELEDGLFVRLTNRGGTASLIVAAPKRTASFDTPDRVKLLNGLIVHLQQAVHTRAAFTDLTNRTQSAAALDELRLAILTVGPEFVVLTRNSAAEAILRAEDGLHMRSGCIATSSTSAERDLRRAVHNVLTTDDSGLRSACCVICPRPSGKRSYVIHVLPLEPGHVDARANRKTALVLVVDAESETVPPAMLLQRLYRLTRSEAEVALQIARGADLVQISDRLSISLATVRTHLQHVFEKTGTHRQAELIRLLLALVP
jgi:DNA-binding CsgD family transcriptional regulator/PAS domain-containing protein